MPSARRLICSALLLVPLAAGCGGNVIVDPGGGGGAGGAPGTTTTTVTSTVTSTTVTTTTTGTSMMCDGSGDCGYGPFSYLCVFCEPTACLACALAGECADELATCQSEPDCMAFVGCVQGCLDQTCFDQCTGQFPNGAVIYNDLLLCTLCDTCPIDCDGPSLGCP